ncbi:MAG: hypothetical protein ACXV9R_04150, partial [Methylobacter sp.]
SKISVCLFPRAESLRPRTRLVKLPVFFSETGIDEKCLLRQETCVFRQIAISFPGQYLHTLIDVFPALGCAIAAAGLDCLAVSL